jgi:hypothetical protein
MTSVKSCASSQARRRKRMIRDLSNLYDYMWRLFMVGMSNCKLPVGHIGLVLNIPRGTTLSVYKQCPLPAHVTTHIGGHRNKEYFLEAKFVSRVDREALATALLADPVWAKYGVCIDVRAGSVVTEVEKIVNNLTMGTKSHVDMAKIVQSGKPEEFRPFWFIKDKDTMDFWRTVHEALAMPTRVRKPVVVKEKRVEEIKDAPYSGPYQSLTWGMREFADELQELLVQKEEFAKKELAYKEMIEHLQSKVNIQYGEIISRKETEAANLRKEVERLTGENKALAKQVFDFEGKLKELTQYVSRKGRVK